MRAMSYEELPYPSLPLSQTHPDRSAAAAALLGMAPAPPDGCRVLEMGCASGGNLLPMAVALPDSRFLGIDLSARQIDAGQALVGELGLRNIELCRADLLEMVQNGSALGTFDYIVCHGVYSWVGEMVQRAILALCKRHLAPQGVAYISYNTYPGFYKRQPIRDMMQFHVAQSAQRGRDDGAAPLSPHAAVQESRALVELLQQGTADRKTSWSYNLQEEAELLRGVPDGYLFHEHLEAENRPCYFHQFAAAAQAAGLQFLDEAEQLGTLADFAPAVRKTLDDADLIATEQYLDFLRGQSLRCTLLCHAEVPLERAPTLERWHKLSIGCACWPEADKRPPRAEIRATTGVAFRSRQRRVTVPDPAFKAVLVALYDQEPRTLGFAALVKRAGELLGAALTEDTVAGILLYAYRSGLVRLHLTPPRFALELGERPLASPLARLQARTQEQVANLRHQIAELSPQERQLLALLDGTRTLAELERGDAAQLLSKQLKPTLQTLARCALLLS